MIETIRVALQGWKLYLILAGGIVAKLVLFADGQMELGELIDWIIGSAGVGAARGTVGRVIGGHKKTSARSNKTTMLAIASASVFMFAAPSFAETVKPIRVYDQNYFTWYGTQTPTVAGDKEIDGALKFQLSVLANLIDYQPLFAHVYLAYTQESFWDVNAPSSPFKTHDFNPELFLRWQPQLASLPALNSHQLGWEHESNGEDGATSRSWDRAYWQADFSHEAGPFGIAVSPKLWWVVKTSDENADIGTTDVTGLFVDDFGGSLNLALAYTPDGAERASMILTAEFSRRYGVVDFAWNANPAWRNYYLFVTGWRGQGDNLVSYDAYTTSFGAGIALLQ